MSDYRAPIAGAINKETSKKDDDVFDAMADQTETRHKLENDSFRQDIGLRKQLAWAFFWLAVGLVGAVLAILLLAGFGGRQAIPFYLESKVLIALMTTTTADIIGLVVVVANYLFPKDGSKSTVVLSDRRKEDKNQQEDEAQSNT